MSPAISNCIRFSCFSRSYKTPYTSHIWTVQHYCNGKIPIPSGKSLYVCFLLRTNSKYRAFTCIRSWHTGYDNNKITFWKKWISKEIGDTFPRIEHSMSPFFYNICESNLQKNISYYIKNISFKFVCPSFPPYYCASFEILYNKRVRVCVCVLCYISLWKDISQYCCLF